MQIELRDFTASIKKDTRENLVSAKNLLDGMADDLDTTATEILECKTLDSPEVCDILEFSHKMNLFDATFVSDTHGNAFEESGIKFSVADQECFQRAMKDRTVVFSEILPSKRFGAIQIIAYPLITADKEQKGVLFGLFSVETFSQLEHTVLDAEKNIYIVDSNGTYINCFDQNHMGFDHGNFWEVLGGYQLKDISMPELKKAFSDGGEGDFTFRDPKQKVNRYGYHMPLGIEDWQIVLTAEESVVNSHIQSIRLVYNCDLVINAIYLTVMLICIFLYFKKANTKMVAVNREISKNNEMLQMAVAHTNHVILEYDIAKKEIELKTTSPDFPFNSSPLLKVPDCFFENNTVTDSSLAVLQSLFEAIETEKSTRADIQLISKNDGKNGYRRYLDTKNGPLSFEEGEGQNQRIC